MTDPLVLDLEQLLHNHRGVAVRMPNWHRQPQKCHFFEIHTGLEIEPQATADRNIIGIQVPDGHVCVIEKLTFSIEYWADLGVRARAVIGNWILRESTLPSVPGQGSVGPQLADDPNVIAAAGAVNLQVVGCCCDTSFRGAANQYLYVYLGYPVYRTAERRRLGDIGWQPEHYRSGVWFNHPRVLGPGQCWVIRTENAAVGDEEPRVSLAGFRGWVIPVAHFSASQEGMVTE